jgi:uncharacterized protein YfaP (DUF2135 family)
MGTYAVFLRDLAESEDREARYKNALIDIRDVWNADGIIRERIRSALGNERETTMHTNGAS